MPSIIGHSFVSLPISTTIMGKDNSSKVILLSVVCSLLPDIDVIGFYLGVNYSSFFGHRGFTHSIFFVALVGFLITVIFFPEIKIKSKRFQLLFLNFFIIGFSHIILDAMTNGGLGAAFFTPLSNARYFFPWRPIVASPLSVRHFFDSAGWAVLRSEFLYIIFPSIVYMILFNFMKKYIREKVS